jgi:hypothetical protein
MSSKVWLEVYRDHRRMWSALVAEWNSTVESMDLLKRVYEAELQCEARRSGLRPARESPAAANCSMAYASLSERLDALEPRLQEEKWYMEEAAARYRGEAQCEAKTAQLLKSFQPLSFSVATVRTIGSRPIRQPAVALQSSGDRKLQMMGAADRQRRFTAQRMASLVTGQMSQGAASIRRVQAQSVSMFHSHR